MGNDNPEDEFKKELLGFLRSQAQDDVATTFGVDAY